MKISKLISVSALALGLGAVVSLAPKKSVAVKAEEESSVVENIEEKQGKFIDELVTPLLIALCSADGLTIISIGVIGYVRRKHEKAREVAHKAQTELLSDGLKKLAELEEKTTEMVSAFESAFENSKAIIESEKAVLVQHAEDVKKIGDLKNAIVCVAEAQLAQIKSEEESVRSGLSHEISELQEKLNALK